jgi:UDP-glucose 4-epimerase
MNSRRSAVLLMGGCGFLGQSIAEHLAAQGTPVRIFDRPQAIIEPLVSGPLVEYYGGDFGALQSFDYLSGVDTVIHLVHTTIPSTSMQNMAYDVESNVIPSIKFFKILAEKGIRKVIYMSSGGTVYGAPKQTPVAENDETCPISSYGTSKLAIENYLQLYSQLYALCGISVRLTNPYGRFQLPGTPIGAVANFLIKAASDQEIEIWGDGSIVRDYIYISDVVTAIDSLIRTDGLDSGAYNLSFGKGYSLNEVASLIRDITCINLNIKYLPGRNFDVKRIVLTCDKLKNATDWLPKVDLPQGILKLWNHLKEMNDK